MEIPAKGQPLLGGKKVEDMITDDTKVLKDGTVIGALKHITDFTAFGSQSDGHYFPVKLGEQYEGKNIKVTGKNVKTEKDREWILFIEDKNTPFKFEDVDSGNTEIVTLKFEKVDLQE